MTEETPVTKFEMKSKSVIEKKCRIVRINNGHDSFYVIDRSELHQICSTCSWYRITSVIFVVFLWWFVK